MCHSTYQRLRHTAWSGFALVHSPGYSSSYSTTLSSQLIYNLTNRSSPHWKRQTRRHLFSYQEMVLSRVSTRTLGKTALFGAVGIIGSLIWARTTIENRVRNAEFYKLAMKTLRTDPGESGDTHWIKYHLLIVVPFRCHSHAGRTDNRTRF